MDLSAPRISFSARLLLGFSLSIILVISVGVVSYRSIITVNEDTKWVTHTYKVIQELDGLTQLATDAETNARGFMISAEDKYEQEYMKYIEQLLQKMEEVQRLTIDNKQQQQRMAKISQLIQQKKDDMDMKIGLRRDKGFVRLNEEVLKGKGKKLMDEIRAECKQMIEEEERLLKIRTDKTAEGVIKTQWTIIIGILVILSVVIALITYIRRTFALQQAAEQAIQEKNANLAILSAENEKRNRLLTGASDLSTLLRVEQNIRAFSDAILAFIADHLHIQIGALYLVDEERKELYLAGSYAYQFRKNSDSRLSLGEGLVGQAALENKAIVFTDVPKDYIRIQSGLGEMVPANIAVFPLSIGKQVIGVMELGAVAPLNEEAISFLEFTCETIAIAIHAALSRIQTAELLMRTQEQAEELEQQQEELKQTNEELSAQTQLLQASEEELRVQQEELKQTNVELEEKAQELEEKNDAIEQARQEVMLQAKELEQTSRYKSEFLANMSHELRTPLNSILILAKLMEENKEKNLFPKQVEYAQVIHKSGNDLLNLINDILDLSKIEAGKVEFKLEDVDLKNIKTNMENLFEGVANQKQIEFSVQLKDVPEGIQTDSMRLEQVLKNLLSNAFKFTAQSGKVQLIVSPAQRHQHHLQHSSVLCFEVIDSGIGIPAEKQALIFEAFQQADGSTSRRYGGTGLGLSISKELVHRLGGEIQLRSEEGKGSTFSIFLPAGAAILQSAASSSVEKKSPAKKVAAKERSKKIVFLHAEHEDMMQLAREMESQDADLQILHATKTKDALALLAEQKEQRMIIDLGLSDADVLEWLAQLNGDEHWDQLALLAYTRDALTERDDEQLKRLGIPVVMESPQAAKRLLDELNLLQRKAKAEVKVSADYQPVLDDVLRDKYVLLVDDDMRNIFALSNVLELNQMKVLTAGDGREAIEKLKLNPQIDIVLMDMMMPEMDGYEAMQEIRKSPKFKNLPMLALTAKAMQGDREKCIEAGASDYISKPVNVDQLLSLMKVWLYQ